MTKGQFRGKGRTFVVPAIQQSRVLPTAALLHSGRSICEGSSTVVRQRLLSPSSSSSFVAAQCSLSFPSSSFRLSLSLSLQLAFAIPHFVFSSGTLSLTPLRSPPLSFSPRPFPFSLPATGMVFFLFSYTLLFFFRSPIGGVPPTAVGEWGSYDLPEASWDSLAPRRGGALTTLEWMDRLSLKCEDLHRVKPPSA